MNDFKTPLTLREALENALKVLSVTNRHPRGGLSLSHGFTPKGVEMLCEKHVRDFLAQKFTAAFIKAEDNAETLDFLTELWKEISKK